jgi:hypothetical protein
VETIGFKNRSKKRAEDFTRERKMPFKKLVYFMLSMIKESTQNALERYFEKAGEETWMSQQAFSEARQKIKWEAFREMFDFTVRTQYSNNEIALWHGLRVSAVDGSIVLLPNDQPLKDYFGTTGCGNKSPAARGSLLYDILNDIVEDARIEPMSIGEQRLAKLHIAHLHGMESFREWKELVIFDRGYGSKELMSGLLEMKIHFLIRVREKFSKAIDAVECGDHIITLEHEGKELTVRVIKFLLTSGIIETLITDMQDKDLEIKDFKELYFKRWPIETKYDELKKKLEIENFSGRLVDNIRQDFYAAMVLTNFAADFYWEAQELVDKEQEGKENKYQYQVNVNHEIGVLKDRLIKVLLEDDNKKRGKMFGKIISLLQKRTIPIRPNRSVPRIQFPRNAKFHHNHKSNC